MRHPSASILSEAVLRTPLKDPDSGDDNLSSLVEDANGRTSRSTCCHSAPGSTAWYSTAVMFLRLPDGRTVAYTENAHHGELIEENACG